MAVWGLVGAVRAFWTRRKPRGVFIDHRVPGLKHPLYLRSRTSDLSVFEQIFLDGDYEIDVSGTPTLIVDAGANVGCATAYFANRFPSCQVVAIEPEASNVDVLRMNAKAYPNVTVIAGGLWSRKTALVIDNPQSGNWGFHVAEAEFGTGIEAVTIDEILKKSGKDFIDILKIDIEGAEREVLQACDSWINKVGVLIIELHDGIKPGCSAALAAAAAKSSTPFAETRRGENVILTRPPLRC